MTSAKQLARNILIHLAAKEGGLGAYYVNEGGNAASEYETLAQQFKLIIHTSLPPVDVFILDSILQAIYDRDFRLFEAKPTHVGGSGRFYDDSDPTVYEPDNYLAYIDKLSGENAINGVGQIELIEDSSINGECGFIENIAMYKYNPAPFSGVSGERVFRIADVLTMLDE